MATSISVSKQSVKELLSSGKDRPFIIPEYQRPYAWQVDEIQTLFDDLLEFSSSIIGSPDNKGTYFLGSIVSYENEQGEQEIIDGQQRITSLFLLLRAVYTLLTSAVTKTKEAENFIKQIEPAIWRTDDLTGEVDYSSILLESRVMNNEGNAILRNILRSGEAQSEAKDNYSRNYILFQNLIVEASKENPMMMYQFIYAMLNKAILLPISADSQETALTIFSTLNDRGMPLSDADIFKAKIYNNHDKEGKKGFIEQWKQLDEQATEAKDSIQQLFYYYMFFLRALDNDRKTTTPGVRKFFASNNFSRLCQNDLIDNLFVILNIWKVVNSRENIESESWSNNQGILQALDILNSYPNEFWKYPVVIYYLRHRHIDSFKDKFALFLNKLIVVLLESFLIAPTVSAVKGDILKLNASIINNSIPIFDFSENDSNSLKERFKAPHRSVVRMMLKILAYCDGKQTELLTSNWEIEHILPQKWQTNYFLRESDEVVKEKIEHLGNKIPFEKRLNIVAGNGYFEKKKKEYASSRFYITNTMSQSPIVEWKLDNISERDVRVSDKLSSMLNSWSEAYKQALNRTTAEKEPTKDDIAKIEEFKRKGWI